ncbi:ATP synthase f1 [Colletotrichum chrysophilum]|uniref:ATP synthase f1 n=1 Tax=Colletotrichum chrysophilum TaxID=1836956 RepID=A0AAD9EB50_9PEZI|nr:ATP synthase f1 [Colletotrichum chrysophilum]
MDEECIENSEWHIVEQGSNVNWTIFHSDKACSNDNGFNGNSSDSNETGYKGNNAHNGFRLESFSPDDAPIRDYSKGFQKSRNEERFLGSRLCLGGIEGAVGSVAGEALSTVAGAQSAMANGNTSNAVKSATSSGAIECAVQTEASLQAMASSHGGGEEGFYDVIKSGVQKTGPAVLYIAKKAVHAVILVIVVELSERFKGAVGAESSATPYNLGDNHNKMGRFNAVPPKQAIGKTSDHGHKAVEVSENSPLDLQ